MSDEGLRVDSIALCARCGAGVASPRPDQETLGRFYASGAYWHASSGRARRAHEASQAWLRVQTVRGFVGGRPLAVADVGAGHRGIARALAGFALGISRYAFVEPGAQAAANIAALRASFKVDGAVSLASLRGPFELSVSEPRPGARRRPAWFSGQSEGAARAGRRHACRDAECRLPVQERCVSSGGAARRADAGLRGVGVPGPRLSPVGLVQRFAARALPLARFPAAERVLERLIWRYAPCDDGTWLRWIFSTH